MYKTKLQEECQRNKWALPEYSCIKDGEDHNPCFRASVSVNGLSFHSPAVSKSSKHALNEAAMVAFLHFTSDTEPIDKGLEVEETHQSTPINSNGSDVKTGTQYRYKMQLQNFAQSKNVDSPLYTSKREGPPHDLQFQATVTVDGHSFESPGYFRTLKESEHAAAKVALMSLSLDFFQGIDTRLYKNLLQELAQNEGFTFPTYKTVKCGPPHKSTFFSSVKVEGEIFHGDGGKSHKLAELSAAKVAYTVFMERKSSRYSDLSSSGSSAEEMLKSSPSMDLLANGDPQESLKPVYAASSSILFEEHVKENEVEEVVSTEDLPINAEVNLQDTTAYPSSPNMEDISGNGNSRSLLGLSSLLITASNTEKSVEMKSYLLCNRVRVFTCIPDITFPKGTVLLPIDDCKWAAVSLEFPNEKN
ncbi:Double-stranded RNA-binding protein [Actinidia chinensis var. chinensis]|uniref:Double-stranded RNA-binding protein n=1 Tax=Actinidia chinensis var. chinensis TaxID=1590841 RepID=A0A2R6PQW5_ACTCC|nr:Double-stranded RNA-binding protein [Actinidia chinensis var. chinensis]